MLNILSHCQAVYEAIQNLDKKCDAIQGRVSRIHRIHVKSLWQNRKPFGYAFKNYNYLLSRKIKYQKMRKREPPADFSYHESYSPTLPVGRREEDDESNHMRTSFHSEEPYEPEEPLFREEEPVLRESPPVPSTFSPTYQPYYSQDDSMPGPSTMPCFASPRAPSTSSVISARASSVVASAVLAQGESSPTNSPGQMNYSLLENKNFGQRTNSSSLCVPPNFVTSVSVGFGSRDLTQGFPKDPSNWSVEEVIQFMEHMDHQSFSPLADLFRHHDIDGKALLLLKSDMMIKYMGLKLGTAIKLCHYIERLKQEKYFIS
ncbi:sex comb on midleg-like protein 1 isoform X2 [Dasypus novemcinctus]